MPIPELSDRYDDAILWAATGNPDAHGRWKVSSTPVALKVRWNNAFSEQLDPFGNTITVDATLHVDRDIAIGSVLWKGTLANLPATSGLHEVKTQNAVQDVKGQDAFRTVGLVRMTDTPNT